MLATEMDTVEKVILPPLITESFKQRTGDPYDLRHNAEFLQLFLNSVHWGTQSISYLAPKIWGEIHRADFVSFSSKT